MLTPNQLRLARHALGLPNDRNRSYRNRYYVSPGGPAMRDFMAMQKGGLAVIESDGANAFCYLTRAGAEVALEPGESLCPEDFPPAATQVAEAA